jgi:predicted DNA-binding protein
MMEGKKMVRTSFRFEKEYKLLLENIAKITSRPMTDELRLLIDKRAIELGLEPVYPLAQSQTEQQ